MLINHSIKCKFILSLTPIILKEIEIKMMCALSCWTNGKHVLKTLIASTFDKNNTPLNRLCDHIERHTVYGVRSAMMHWCNHMNLIFVSIQKEMLFIKTVPQIINRCNAIKLYSVLVWGKKSNQKRDPTPTHINTKPLNKTNPLRKYEYIIPISLDPIGDICLCQQTHLV